MRTLLCLLLVCFATASGEPEATYPEGDSTQEFDGLPFALRVPAALDTAKPLGLVLIEPGSLSDLDALADEPYVIVAPSIPPDRASGLWSAGEVKVIVKLVAHLQKALGVDPARMHAVAVDKTSLHDIFEPIVFRKKTPFASATYVRSSLLRSSIPSEAKKKMGVLAYEWQAGAQDGGGVVDFLDRFEGKVRIAELRQADSPLSEPYFLYWLDVMGGGFTPGQDLSLPWIDLSAEMAEIAGVLKARGVGGMLYFFSKKDDASSADARKLQNEVFFDRSLRAMARNAACLRFERETSTELFAALGLKSTPAVVIVDSNGVATASYTGKIRASKLIKSLKKVIPKDKR